MNEYFPPEILSIEPGIALLISDSIYGQTNNSAKQLITLKNLFSQTLTIETEIYILHKLAELDDIEYIKDRSENLLINRSKYLNFELEKYIGDILSDYLEPDEFISYCNTIFEEEHTVGLLYSMVRVYDELGQRDLALPIINEWLALYPANANLNQLYEYMIQINSLQ